jgi:hypothetical protein
MAVIKMMTGHHLLNNTYPLNFKFVFLPNVRVVGADKARSALDSPTRTSCYVL